jgi:hypothetical protein
MDEDYDDDYLIDIRGSVDIEDILANVHIHDEGLFRLREFNDGTMIGCWDDE